MEEEKPPGPLPALLLGLTAVTGLVDAFSFLTLGPAAPPPPVRRGGRGRGVDHGRGRGLLGGVAVSALLAARRMTTADR